MPYYILSCKGGRGISIFFHPNLFQEMDIEIHTPISLCYVLSYYTHIYAGGGGISISLKNRDLASESH